MRRQRLHGARSLYRVFVHAYLFEILFNNLRNKNRKAKVFFMMGTMTRVHVGSFLSPKICKFYIHLCKFIDSEVLSYYCFMHTIPSLRVMPSKSINILENRGDSD